MITDTKNPLTKYENSTIEYKSLAIQQKPQLFRERLSLSLLSKRVSSPLLSKSLWLWYKGVR